MSKEISGKLSRYGYAETTITYNEGIVKQYKANPLLVSGQKDFQFFALGDLSDGSYYHWLVVNQTVKPGNHQLSADREPILALTHFANKDHQQITEGWVSLDEVGDYPKGSFEYKGKNFIATGTFAFKAEK